MIDQEILQKLIAIGRSGDLESPEIHEMLAAIRQADTMNPLHAAVRKWDMARLSDDDTAALTKGLGIAEARLRLPGGSVAAVIHVFRELRRRSPRLAEEVANWIADQWEAVDYDNYYGKFRKRARDAREAHDTLMAIEDAQQANAEMEEELLRDWGTLQWERRKADWLAGELAALQKQERRVAERLATERQQLEEDLRTREREFKTQLKEARRHNHEIIQQHIEERKQRVVKLGENLSPADRLLLAASREDIDIRLFPREWAIVDDEVLKRLSDEDRDALFRRLHAAKYSSWKKLRKRLEEFQH